MYSRRSLKAGRLTSIDNNTVHCTETGIDLIKTASTETQFTIQT